MGRDGDFFNTEIGRDREIILQHRDTVMGRHRGFFNTEA